MSLSQRLYDKFEEWRENFTTGVAGFLVTVTGRGIELVLDIVGKAMKPALMPTIDKLLDQEDLPPEVKEILTQIKTTDGQWQSILLGGMGGAAIGGASSAAFGPWFRKINSKIETFTHSQVFDYPIILAAWLRGVETPLDIFQDLNYFGYSPDRIELLKKLVWLRLDPLTIQLVWLRDNAKYEHLWQDLKDQGWDDERIEVYKELAHIVPPISDMVRFADFGSFDPEIIEIWREFYDAPSWIKEPMAKAGITGEWADKYWFSHWVQPGRYELGLMRHRGYIDDQTVKNAYRTQGFSSFWQDLLLKLSYEPYTRVDVRRMYKVEVLDEAGVKKAYMDLGYDEEKAANLTEFTLKYYARSEDAVEDEEEKIRELTRSDICDGYRRGIFNPAETRDLLANLGYTPESIQFYIDREDLKKEQALKDAYAANYRRLFVIGIKDADSVKAEMVDLGFLPGEVDELLRQWYVEKLRREARPSRSDLARFLKKEIITEEIWRQGMADLGYADQFIDWYLEDIKK
jgi:hypothetical protein